MNDNFTLRKILRPRRPSKGKKAQRVLELLIKMHGEPPFVPRREPLHELISTMLSHDTTRITFNISMQRDGKKNLCNARHVAIVIKYIEKFQMEYPND